MDAVNSTVKYLNEQLPLRRCAPETIKQQVCSLASDVYMFGSCLWEFFTRTSPFYWIQGNIEVGEAREKKNEQLIKTLTAKAEKYSPEAWPMAVPREHLPGSACRPRASAGRVPC